MDAQHAAGPDKTKTPASPGRSGSRSAEHAEPALNDASEPPVVPVVNSSRSPVAQSKPSPKAKTSPARHDSDDGTAAADRDSDAETIVLPGKDGHSPSKARKVKHEDTSDGETRNALTSREDWSSRGGQGDKDLSPTGDAGSAPQRKKSRVSKDSAPRDRPSRPQEGSSGLSSAPSSPRNQRRRLAGGHDSDSDADRRRSPKLAATARAKSVDHPSSNKRKASRAGSDHDEAGDRKAARRRRLEEHPAWLSSKDRKSASRESRGGHKEGSLSSAKRDHDGKNRSVSPPVRAHRRSISTTQLPSSLSANGLNNKKKRLPPPLRSTEDHSDESSAGGSPHPRNSNKVRNLSTPATGESNISPAKMPLGKKHVDAHGQTPLARACNKGEYDVAKQRLTERPEDLNFADYAGNTPLQSAALKGFDDIVKLLLDAGCNVDSFNSSRDTPLIDAVDNGHLDVIKLLLAAGANPRKANLSGEEPLDRVSDQLDNAEEIRTALTEAKLRHAEVRRTSEDIHPADHQDGRSSHGADSPRHSPVPAHLSRRPGTVRSTKTGNHHLYVNLDEKTLRSAAAKGDEETVTRVLQVKDRYDDPEAMVAAARGGHEVVIQLLLALGGADPDPAPVPGLQSEFSTPMLAAIGQENINVIQLLLSQQNFDPTRRYKGATYYEIAQRRQGSNWKEEEQLLKNSYDAFKKSHRDGNKTKSPGRRERARALDRDAAKQAALKELREAKEKEEARPPRRKLSDASRDLERKKSSSGRPNNSPKEKRRSNSFSQRDNQTSPKRAPGRLKQQEDRPLSTISDREASPALSHKSAPKPKRNDSDFAALSSEGESVKPRRKLVSKGELRGEREKQRRASLVSNASSSVKDPLSPRDPRQDENADKSKEPVSEKYHDRTKALKRDESRERHALSGDATAKRHRSSTTPPQPSNAETDSAEAPAKRRRLDVEGKERRTKPPDSNDDRPKASREGSTKLKEGDAKALTSSKTSNLDGPQHKQDPKSSVVDKTSIQVKSEDADVDMPDAVPPKASDEAASRTLEEPEAAGSAEAAAAAAAKKREDAGANAEEIRLKEKEKQQRDAEEKQRKDEEVAKQREVEIKLREEEDNRRRQEEEEKQRKAEEEKKRRAEEDKQREAEEEKKKRQAEQQKRLEEEERVKREAEEKKQREEEARQLREEEEKRQKEEERKRLEEEERQRKADEERRQREEEERLRKAQLEREAAEEARRKREEEERKEREHRDRLKREEAERKRAAHEAEMRRLREEQERQQRLANLPPLLQWLDTCPNPQIPEFAKRFRRLVGVRYDTIRPETTGTPEGREQWVLNVQAALLLGVKDLGLARYTGWSRVPASHYGKLAIWRLEQDHFALTSKDDFDLGLQLPNLYGSEENPQKNGKISFQAMVRLRNHARDKFLSMNMFFVKLSDLMFIVPTFPHLRNTEVIVNYCEVREASSPLPYVPKWRQDPGVERFHGFAPMNKYYVNGTMVKEQLPGMSPTSKTPFPEGRVPRRGLQQVYPDDPEYAQLCQQQGLEHLLKAASSPSLPNGVHPSPPISHESLPETIDRSHSDVDATARASLTAEAQQHQDGPNGVKDMGDT